MNIYWSVSLYGNHDGHYLDVEPYSKCLPRSALKCEQDKKKRDKRSSSQRLTFEMHLAMALSLVYANRYESSLCEATS